MEKRGVGARCGSLALGEVGLGILILRFVGGTGAGRERRELVRGGL